MQLINKEKIKEAGGKLVVLTAFFFAIKYVLTNVFYIVVVIYYLAFYEEGKILDSELNEIVIRSEIDENLKKQNQLDELKKIQNTNKPIVIDPAIVEKLSSPYTAKQIKGSDLNKNGIRDDVDAYVASKVSVYKNPAKIECLSMFARSYQTIMVANLNNKDELKSATHKWLLAMGCVYKDHYSDEDMHLLDEANKLRKELEEMTANNSMRLEKLKKWQKTQS